MGFRYKAKIDSGLSRNLLKFSVHLSQCEKLERFVKYKHIYIISERAILIWI